MNKAATRHSSEAESYLIGAMLTNTGVRNNLLGEMVPQDFYQESHRKIFVAIGNLDQDAPSLSGWINPRDLDLAAVDQQAVARILSTQPSTARWKKAKSTVQMAAKARSLATNIEAWAGELEANEDVNMVTSRALSTLEEVLSSGASDGAQHISTATAAVWRRIQEIRAKKGIIGVRTGLARFDHETGGVQRERNIIIAARSGHGKSTLATTIVKNVLRGEDPPRVLMQSTEMTREQYVTKLARMQCNLTDEEMKTGDISDEKMRAMEGALEKCNDLPLWVDDFAMATPDALRRNILRLKPDLVVIDYLQRMRLPKDLQGRSRYEDTSTLSLLVDSFKLTYKVPLLTFVQLSRKSEDRDEPRPRMSDIRDSGQIEQDADLIMGLWRPSKYRSDEDPNMSKFDCLKNRHGDEDWGIKLYKNDGIDYLTDDPGLGIGLGGHVGR